MIAPPAVFKTFFEPSPGVAEAIRRATARTLKTLPDLGEGKLLEGISTELDSFAKSPGFLKLLEQSREAWRAVGVDPELPVVGRMRALAAVAGLPWEESEKLIHDEPPGEWFESLRVRAAAAVRADQALPAAAAALPAAAAAALVDAEEVARFTEIDPRTIRRKLEGVECEPGPRRRWRWDLARPVLVAWTANSRIHRLRPLKWPEDPSRLKNPSKNPEKIRR